MFYNQEKCRGRIRHIRKQNGYTQEQLAEELSMDRSVLSRIEAGKADGQSFPLCFRLQHMYRSVDAPVYRTYRIMLIGTGRAEIYPPRNLPIPRHMERVVDQFLDALILRC